MRPTWWRHRPCPVSRRACPARTVRQRRGVKRAVDGLLRRVRGPRSRSRRRCRCGTRPPRRVSPRKPGKPHVRDPRSCRPWRRSFAGTRPTRSSSLNQGRVGPRTTRRRAPHQSLRRPSQPSRPTSRRKGRRSSNTPPATRPTIRQALRRTGDVRTLSSSVDRSPAPARVASRASVCVLGARPAHQPRSPGEPWHRERTHSRQKSHRAGVVTRESNWFVADVAPSTSPISRSDRSEATSTTHRATCSPSLPGRVLPRTTPMLDTRCTNRVAGTGKAPALPGPSQPIACRSHVVGEGGLEPPRPFEHWHLKPARLPFRHSPERKPYASKSPGRAQPRW